MNAPQESTPAFDPNDWARRWKRSADEAERNAYMDSGWSLATAERCQRETAIMLLELFKLLKTVELKPDDFFDRPALAAVLAAVHESQRGEGGGA